MYMLILCSFGGNAGKMAQAKLHILCYFDTNNNDNKTIKYNNYDATCNSIIMYIYRITIIG